jgi:hypothetical protein
MFCLFLSPARLATPRVTATTRSRCVLATVSALALNGANLPQDMISYTRNVPSANQGFVLEGARWLPSPPSAPCDASDC